MKRAVVVVMLALAVLCAGCKKKHLDPGGPVRIAGGSGSATGTELQCSDAAKKFTALMAAGPGELADLKPDEGMKEFVKVTIEEACDVDWSPGTRACIAAAGTAAGLAGCWKDAAGFETAKTALHEVVEEIRAKQAAGAGSGSSAGAGSGSGAAPGSASGSGSAAP